ncbi:hypothetical protein F7734_36990 [Scytonema sp. UIC 10036]|uniref:hypothetical protein n=1 Tax=Scytonema sp. UIC 10036 TaxID=2304196 RepID=UPI0012DA7A78|nr:hypothetical protein [Scytonema sp. UIC 10036]MUG97617.1 hypothetical protein [Scytonema sp. UIC 10036]
MENWQFLIQQQGDRSWRPLESPNEEIIEGRYRIVARSNRTSMDVEVRIAHTSTLEMPPKRRIQRRSRRINSDGLMAVIPFTYLKPGIWELRCSSDLMSEVLGTSWQQDVRLQVLPKVTIGQAGQESKEVLAADSESEQEEDIQPVNPVWLKGETAEQILNNLIELALPDSEAVLEDEETADDTLTSVLECPLSLTLDKEIYTVSWGQTLTVNGCVKLKESTHYERIYSGEIRIELYSPQGSELIRRVRQSLPEKLLPFHVRCSVEIPLECASKLILAEMSLYGTISLGSNTLLLARESFTITADVADLLAISAASYKERDIVEDTQEIELLDTSEAKKSNKLIGLEFFNLVKTGKTSEPIAVNPIPNKTLPPKINKDSSRQSAPQLPRIASLQNKTIAPSAAVPALSSADDIGYVRTRSTTFPYLRRIKAFIDDGQKVESKPLELFNFQPLNNQQALVETPNGDSAQLEEGDTQIQNEPFEQSISQPMVEETQAQFESPEQNSSPLVEEEREPQKRSLTEIFPASSSELIVTGAPRTSPLIKQWMQSQGYAVPEPINLRDQDYYDIDTVPISVEEEKETRAQENAQKLPEEVQTEEHQDAENSEADTVIQQEVATNVVADVVDEISVKPTDNLPVTTPHYSKARLTSLAKEIVVDDDNFDELLTESSTPALLQQEEQTASDVPVLLSVVSAIAQPLPVPQIYLPKGELISGKSVMLRVRLAERRPELAVKFWVEDCQTRQLIDGPRWLINFLPLISGGMEELIHINVPYGCLDIRLEAIAVDMATKQESDKVSIQRTVVPPDLPNFRPDELLGI